MFDIPCQSKYVFEIPRVVLIFMALFADIENNNHQGCAIMLKRYLLMSIAALALICPMGERPDAIFTPLTPAYAICSSDSIINDCCFKFSKVLEGDAMANSPKTRERMALAAFRQCLAKDLGCSNETTEMKSRELKEVLRICR